MKYINLNLDFGIDRKANPGAASDRDLALDWIGNAIGYGYRQGLGSTDRRLFLSVLNKIEEVKKTDLQYLEINSVEQVFLAKAFNQLTCSPTEAKWITMAEDAFKAATDEKPEPVVVAPAPSTENVGSADTTNETK